MEQLRQTILADINSYCIRGVLTGHIPAVAKNYQEIFSNMAPLRIAGGPVFLRSFPDALCLKYHTDEVSCTLKNKFRVIYNMWQLFRNCQQDIIVLQSSAVATAFWGIALFKARKTPLYMIQYNTMGLDSPVKRFLYRLAKRKINGIICPNADVGQAYGRPYCVVPDYIYTGADKSNEADDDKKYDFCMIGSISRDKGIIEAAAKLAGSPYRVVIAGRPADNDIEQELRRIAAAADNIELRLRFIDAAEYTDIIRLSRYGVLNYSGAYSEHSSGVIYDFLFAGLPIIGTHCKSLQIVEEYGMGQLFHRLEDWDISSLPDKETYLQYQRNIRQYYRIHEESRAALVRFVTQQAAQ